MLSWYSNPKTVQPAITAISTPPSVFEPSKHDLVASKDSDAETAQRDSESEAATSLRPPEKVTFTELEQQVRATRYTRERFKEELGEERSDHSRDEPREEPTSYSFEKFSVCPFCPDSEHMYPRRILLR